MNLTEHIKLYEDVTFDNVLALLQQWEDGTISDGEVYDFAEHLYYLRLANHHHENYPERDPEQAWKFFHQWASNIDWEQRANI